MPSSDRTIIVLDRGETTEKETRFLRSQFSLIYVCTAQDVFRMYSTIACRDQFCGIIKTTRIVRLVSTDCD
jgi:hypothetical protein